MRSRVLVAVVSCLVTAAVVGGFAVAAIPNGNTIHGCRNKTTFVLRVIDKDLGQACSSSETALSWSSWSWRGPYLSTTTYKIGDVVRYNGSSYLVRTFNPPVGTPPTNTTYWALVASRGDQGPAGPPGSDATAPRVDYIQMAPEVSASCNSPTIGAEWTSIGICSAANNTNTYLRQIDASRYPAGTTFRLEVGIIAHQTGIGKCLRLSDIDVGGPPLFAPVAGSTVCGSSSPGQQRLRSGPFTLPLAAHGFFVEVQTGGGLDVFDPVLIATW